MRSFVVIVDERGADKAAEVKARLDAAYADVYEISPTVFVVASDGLTESVAISAGFKDRRGLGEHEVTGVVFRIDIYSGYTRTSLWEWLRKAEGE